jgi:hypothetical protein
MAVYDSPQSVHMTKAISGKKKTGVPKTTKAAKATPPPKKRGKRGSGK